MMVGIISLFLVAMIIFSVGVIDVDVSDFMGENSDDRDKSFILISCILILPIIILTIKKNFYLKRNKSNDRRKNE